ncbi:Glutamate dehydrogenase [Vitis vinifera]|uniref:Glutamate dehydrogenase n=1 Tax=Vitis vinifera TaxID=29760 RepID=A0A438K7C9_VITVI|nr:Glutamate dehydrogenase [Vitis vinifera]
MWLITTMTRDYSKTYARSKYYDEAKPWSERCDVAFPCASQNEIDQSDAINLVNSGCRILIEANVLIAPAMAAGAGGSQLMGGKGGRRLLGPYVYMTVSKLGVGSLMQYGAHPQGGWHGQKVEEGVSMAPSCLFWFVWWERNRRIFDWEELNDHKLKEAFIRSLMEWSRTYWEGLCFSVGFY